MSRLSLVNEPVGAIGYLEEVEGACHARGSRLRVYGEADGWSYAPYLSDAD